MSENISDIHQNHKASPEDFEAAIAAHNAKLEAKYAAQAAAARQEQVDIIKEAIKEALRESAHLFQQPLVFQGSGTHRNIR